MNPFFHFPPWGRFSMGTLAAAGSVYAQLGSWRLLRRASVESDDAPSGDGRAGQEVSPSLDGDKRLPYVRELALLRHNLAVPIGNNGNPTVQPDVTRGTIAVSFATSGAAMDSKPVPTLERAFARTEVAGLDELPKPASMPQAEVAAPARPMIERRGQPDAAHLRPAGPVGASASLSLFSQQRLEPEAERWLKALPVAVRPVITARRHPHIVNKFSRIWGRSELVAGYLDELLISNRPGRRGFAMEVLEELSLLQSLVHERRLS
jgi:hypothetical protein